MKDLFLCIAFLLLASTGYSQLILKGRVLDKTTGEPLENAAVNAGAAMTLTDVQGNFRLHLAQPADSIHISMMGYTALTATISPEPMVYKLSRGPIDLRSVTVMPLPLNASFSTITAIDVNMHALNSAQDLMRLVPGLSLMQHQGGGIADHIFFRGFDADHGTDVSVWVDDMPLNQPSQIHGQGFSDLHFLIPELVTNLEYGKGPYYADHGDFTTAGYVNFKTADFLDKNEVKIEGGGFNTGRIMAAVNLLGEKARQRGESAYIAGEGFYTDGPYDYAQHFNRGNLFAKYIVNISPSSQLKITGSLFNSVWRSSGEIPTRAVEENLISRWGYIDSAQGGNTDRATGIARLTTRLSDHLSMQNQLYYAHSFFNLNYDETFFSDDPINGDQLRQRERRDEYGYNGKITQHDYFQNGASLTSSAGIGFQLNQIKGGELSHTKNYSDVLEYLEYGNTREWTLNAFLNEQYHVNRWLFDAGARIDYINTCYQDFLNPTVPAKGKATASPKISAEYTFSNAFQAYLKLGKGFHSNDAKAVAQNQSIAVMPAAYGADIGINWKPLPKLYINGALWYLFLNQEFTYDGDEGELDPGDKTRRMGFDFSARYEFTPWLFADVDVIGARARDAQAPKGQAYLPLAVPFYASGGLYFKLPCGFNGGWNTRYMSKRPANEDYSLTAKGYFLNDLTANYTRRHYEFGLEIQNIFNYAWKDAQYEVQSQLHNEPTPVDDVSFTPGIPFYLKLKFAIFF